MAKRRIAVKNTERCHNVRACWEMIACPGVEECVGCGACAAICPNSAIEMVEVDEGERVEIEVDGNSYEIPAGITVKQALKSLGFQITEFPGEGLFMPCRTGGCWSCALKIDGELKTACLSAVRNGMKIKTSRENFTPQRLVSWFSAHPAGGAGTPWRLKANKEKVDIEVVCFTSGCNFRCPQCQNWAVTFQSKGKALTPEEAAKQLTETRKTYGVDRMAISGGECTLNRRWLVGFLREIRRLNPDAHLNVDTNGSILTEDYIDELVEAGMTDIGIDLKALRTQTFIHITGLNDELLAEKYKETAWNAVEYLLKQYSQVFLGIGIPYNPELIELAEIEEMGWRISGLSPEVQVCAMDYRAEFRRTELLSPSYAEMIQVHKTLKNTGLKTVICQSRRGYIGLDGKLPALCHISSV